MKPYISSMFTSTLNNVLRCFSSIPYKIPRLETYNIDSKILPTKIEMSKEESWKIFRMMTLIRRCEIECDNIYKSREIRGFLHLYDGQEAVLAGIESEINYEDPIITAYRVHGHALTRGDTPYQLFSEMLGKADGSSKAKGGSMHYYRKKTNFYGGNGIVGSHIPIGVGLGFALKYLNKKNVCITMFGDGAMNQGQFFEASNMAALWKLPVIFAVENNLYAMGTACTRATGNTKLFTKGSANSIPGIRIDGQNIFIVKAIAKFAKQWVIEKGPLLIEFDTYRYHGHSMSDPGLSYRSREEVIKVRKERDPIQILKDQMTKYKIATSAELKKVESEIKEEVEESIKKAKSAPFPELKEAYSDVFIQQDNFFLRKVELEDSYYPSGEKPY